ncbi:MAG TPA: hypothetical protein VHO48_15510 [Anaerolineaceae bacterium]|nr:hypothetical protein [Anaerolineaceae bacterium]
MEEKTDKEQPEEKPEAGLSVRTQLRAGDYDECYRTCRREGGPSGYCGLYCTDLWPQ